MINNLNLSILCKCFALDELLEIKLSAYFFNAPDCNNLESKAKYLGYVCD